MKTQKENKARSFWRDQEKLKDQLVMYILSDGHEYSTGRLALILNLRWDTVHKHLNSLYERGRVNKIRCGAS